MKVYECIWKHMKAYESVWKHMKAYESIWNRMKMYESIWKRIKVYQSVWKSIKACESVLKHIKSIQKRMKTCESIQKRAYQSTWLYHAASSSLDCWMLSNDYINVPKSVLLKCETAWEAFKQGTIRRLRNKEKHRNKDAKNVKHKGSRFIGKRFFLVL